VSTACRVQHPANRVALDEISLRNHEDEDTVIEVMEPVGGFYRVRVHWC